MVSWHAQSSRNCKCLVADRNPREGATLRYAGRREFIGNLAAFVPPVMLLAAEVVGPKSKHQADPALHFSTPECDVEMSVKSYGKISSSDLAFVDRVTNRRICASTEAAVGRNCTTPFTGALAVVVYKFGSQSPARIPGKLRERVVTIDHDVRIAVRPPFEEFVPVEQNMASDIQAFGYDPGVNPNSDIPTPYASPWCLMRQDLYINDQASAFLIVHWKHSTESIQLLDVIPGDRTRSVRG